jgi:hypothetical protein
MPTKLRDAASYSNKWVNSIREPVSWIWEGLVAERAITLLSAPEKTGKTTLLSLLLDRRRGGGQLLGRNVRVGRTMLCSEEDDLLWALRQPPLDFGSQLEYHKPLGCNPSPGRWRRFIDHLLDFEEGYFDLLVIDTVMNFLPAGQNNPTRLRKALNEFRVITNLPAAVLLLHQTCAARSRTRARGPLAGFADILIDMQIPSGEPGTRRRHFHGVGRYPGTLQHAAAELNADGTDYVVLPDALLATSGLASLETVREILSQSATPLTRQEILSRWPEGESPPRADSLWRLLARGCEMGLFVRSGDGTKAEAFGYEVGAAHANNLSVDP